MARQKNDIPKEIERKFLVRYLPAGWKKYPHASIIQGYILIAEDGAEVRLRKHGERFFQTIKSGGTDVRDHLEIEITEKQFNALWSATSSKRISKTGYRIPLGIHVVELYIHHGNLAGHITAEVEFKSEKERDRFIPPPWFGREVTKNKKYKSQYLALHGMPKAREAKKID